MMPRCLTLAAAVALALSGAARAADLPRTDPASVGLDAGRLDRITALLKDDVDHHVLPGAVLMVLRHGKVAFETTVGDRDPQTKAPAAETDIYRIYSMSKPITVVAALMLMEQGRINLDDPVAKYLPQFSAVQVSVPDGNGGTKLVPPNRPMTIQDLMRHSAGLTYGFFGEGVVKKAYVDAHLLSGDFDNASFVDRISKLPLGYQPGTTWDYSHSIDVLAAWWRWCPARRSTRSRRKTSWRPWA